MGGENNINFNSKFTNALNQDIKLDEILNESEDKKAKTTEKLSSIFNLFDENPNGALDINEVNKMLKHIDRNKDKNISEEEIADFSKANGLDKKVVKTFIESVHNKLANLVKQDKMENFKKNNSRVRIEGSYYSYKMEKTEYDNGYIKYDTNFDNKNSATAIYNKENDVLRDENLNNKIEISGIQAFKEEVFKDGKFIKPKADCNSYPTISIKTKDGKQKDIELHIDFVTIAKYFNKNQKNMNNEDQYMFILTNVLDQISKLPPETLENLTNDKIKYIRINDLSNNREFGTAGQSNKQNDEYYEYIEIDASQGLFDTATWVHEIGHTVDTNVKGFTTDAHKEILEKFIKDVLNDTKFNGCYALSSPEELYAEYYTYKQLGKDADGRGAYTLFSNLDELMKDGDIHGWKEVKAILDNVENLSLEKTKNYENESTQLKTFISEVNSQSDAISLDKLDEFDRNVLWDCFNNNNIRERFEEAIKDNEILAYQYKSTEDPLDVVKNTRNFPEIKPIIEELIKNADVVQQEKDRFENLSFNGALKEVRTIIDNEQVYPLPSTLLKRINQKGPNELKDLLNSEKLRECIVRYCSNENVPKSLKEAFSKDSNTPITLDTLMTFKNLESVKRYLVFDRGYFKVAN